LDDFLPYFDANCPESNTPEGMISYLEYLGQKTKELNDLLVNRANDLLEIDDRPGLSEELIEIGKDRIFEFIEAVKPR